MATEYSPNDDVAQLFQELFSKYLNVAALAAFLFDYFLTLSSEVHHVWGRKWEISRIIFTTSRYLPFIPSAIIVHSVFYGQKCDTNNIQDVIYNVGIVSAELILVLRTYALWERSRRVLAILMALGVVFCTAAMVIRTKVTFSLPGDSEWPYAWYSYGCTSPTWRNSAFELSFLMAFEIILQCMNTWRKFRTYRDVQSQTLNTLYWDGIMYMFGVILLTTTNVAVIAAAPIASIPALETAQVAIHSVLASRIFFNLKECDERIRGGGAEPDISLDTLRYRSLSVGTSLSRVEHSVT